MYQQKMQIFITGQKKGLMDPHPTTTTLRSRALYRENIKKSFYSKFIKD